MAHKDHFRLPGTDEPAVRQPSMHVTRWHSITEMIDDLSITEMELAMHQLVAKLGMYIHEKEGK